MSVNLLQLLVDSSRNITVSRYCSIAGFTVLIHDWLLTLSDEIDFIWLTRRNWITWVYLTEKYTGMVTLFFVNFILSGLTGIQYSNRFCQIWLPFNMIFGTVALQLYSALVFMRVAALWEHRRWVNLCIWTTLVITTVGSLTALIIFIAHLDSKVEFLPEFQLCGMDPSSNVQFFATVWGIPLVCDALVILMTALNALDRPRNMDTKLASILAQDGIFYFLGLGLFHLGNVLIIGLGPISLVFCGGYLAWSVSMTLMKRFLINLQRRETENANAPKTSPLGIPLSPINSKFTPESSDEDIKRYSRRSGAHTPVSFLPKMKKNLLYDY